MTVEAPIATRQAAVQEQAELARTLAAAFADDPVFGWLLPDQLTREERLRRFFAIELRHMAFAHGTVWTGEGLPGAAICMPPGAWQLPPRVALTQGPAFVRAFGRRLPIATALQAAMELRHERRPHWYVLAIGVRPEHQGRGLGTALLSPTLARCDREGLPAYLEASSDRNVALYERLGFEHVRELRLAGSPPLRLMLRPPQGVQASAAA
jgi:GNAT superfamily N-acetyltransferase